MKIKTPCLKGFALILFSLILICESTFSQKKTTTQSQQQKKPASTAQSKKKPSSTALFQNKSIINFTQSQIDTFRIQSGQLVSFFEGMLNFLADPSNAVRDKQTIITQSYSKIFWGEKVQVEDDLDQNRMVPLYKDIPAYLSDVNFFFQKARFQYTVQDVSVESNQSGQTYFKVTANRNIAGVTVNGDSVNWNKVRYFEINYNDSMQQLKVVSIYTTKLNEKDDMRNWWNGLSGSWKNILGKNLLVSDTIPLSSVSSYNDTVAVIGDTAMRIDSIGFYNQLLRILNLKEIDVSDHADLSDVVPLNKLSSLTRINISNTGVMDLMPLRNLNNLEELNISGSRITTLEPLKYLTRIRVLKLAKTSVIDITLVSGFNTLQVMDISRTGLENLEPLKDLIGLKDLRFDGTKISDLQPLSAMTALEVLSFRNTPVSDISPLKNLTRLTLVHFSNTKVSSLKPLADLKELKRIYCDSSLITKDTAIPFILAHPDILVVFESGNLLKWWDSLTQEWKKVFALYTELNDVPSTEQLHRLIIIDSLNVNGRASINSLSPVVILSELRRIECNNTAVDSFDPLKYLVNLKMISASGSKVTDLSTLGKLVNLEILNVDNTAVKDLTPVSNLKNLDFIYADNSGVTLQGANQYLDSNPSCLVIFQTYENNSWWKNLPEHWQESLLKQLNLTGTPDKIQLQRIANLESLVIKENMQVVSLQPVVYLSRLKELQFSDTRVISLDPLGKMNNLTVLRFPKNPISNLTPIANLTGLKELDLSNTQVEDLEPIQNLVKLEILKFSGTQVKNLKYIQKFVQLKKLEFFNTKISSLDDLENMQKLESLMIFNTKVSEKKVEKFKSMHPNCEVVYYYKQK